MDAQISLGVDFGVPRPWKCAPDLSGIAARRHHKIVLENPSAAMKGQVHAGIERAIPNALIVRNPGDRAAFAGIAQVVGSSRKQTVTFDFRPGRRTRKQHAWLPAEQQTAMRT